MDDRACSRRARRRARLALRRRPPQRDERRLERRSDAGALLPERRDPRPSAGRVGRPPVGALFLLPLWNPVLVAELVGTLASLASGRFVMQCALGGGRSQFDAMGVSLRDRVRLFESGLDTIRRLLAGDEVNGARIAPVAPEPIEAWIGAQAPPAIDRAARLGDAWLAGPDATWRRREDFARPLPRAVRRPRSDTDGHRDPARRPRRVFGRRSARVADPVLARGYRGFDPSATIVGGARTPSRDGSRSSARWATPT